MIDYSRFHSLSPDARRICFEFLERGEHAERGGDRYASFFLLWTSFNNWMSCVTGRERDAEMIRDLGNDPRLNQAFIEITVGQLADQRYGFRENLERFSRMWPVFKAQDVVARYGIEYSYKFDNRTDFNQAIIGDNRIARKPAGWVAGSTPRWSDLISTIYQVRCNLIHGHKTMTGDGDRELVEYSSRLLWTFIYRSGCYDW